MRKQQMWGWGVAAAVATAAMWWFGDGLNPWWPLLWVAPVPVLLFALRASWPAAAVVSFAAWLAGSGSLWGYLHRLAMPFMVWLVFFSAISAGVTLGVLLFRALVRRGAVWGGIVAFAAAIVVQEFLRSLFTVHGTAGSLAYTQLRFLPFLQLASLTGPWGMTFLLSLFPAALACVIHLRRSAPRVALRVAAITVGVVGAVLVFGWIRLATAPRGPVVRVGLAASDLPENLGTARPGAPAMQLLRAYATEAKELAAQGAQAIVLPEKLVVVGNADVPAADALFQSIADESGATIVVGVLRDAKVARYNQARVYAPHPASLHEVPTYDKEHMLPPFETPLTPGKSLVTVQAGSMPAGVAICKDMDFFAPADRYGRDGMGLMLVPAWDFRMDDVWHGHIAVMRGVEDGFSLVRAAKGGFLTVSDNRGRIVAERRSDAAPFSTLLATVPAEHSATLFLRWGDWFAWACCLLLAGLLGWLWADHFHPRHR